MSENVAPLIARIVFPSGETYEQHYWNGPWADGAWARLEDNQRGCIMAVPPTAFIIVRRNPDFWLQMCPDCQARSLNDDHPLAQCPNPLPEPVLIGAKRP